ncbi:DUF4197 domain-containing protein [Deferribacteraceae bacterium V6Fe1]|nr:DUF4197 domain-containing protein [Deferribacteraceae bacterium V6Fe1]
MRHYKISALILAFVLGCITFAVANDWINKGLNAFSSKSKEMDTSSLSSSEISKAFTEALLIGSEKVVARLGVKNGFNADPAVHIPLPKELITVKKALSNLEMSGTLDELEVKLNRAAEVATPKAKKIFKKAIVEMSFEDVKKIYNGPEDSATNYFKAKMTPELQKEMLPIVKKSLSEVGAVKTYNIIMKKYSSIPFAPKVDADINKHVVEKGMEGIFYYLAEEEAAIRKDPAKQTTSLLKKVFGK